MADPLGVTNFLNATQTEMFNQIFQLAKSF